MSMRYVTWILISFETPYMESVTPNEEHLSRRKDASGFANGCRLRYNSITSTGNVLSFSSHCTLPTQLFYASAAALAPPLPLIDS
jgi:hypothetical protein